MSQVNVLKKDGAKEPFNAEKIHKVINWAVEGVSNVNPSDIEINAHLESKKLISTKEIHEALIESCANLISLKTPNYQIVGAKLLNYQLRKDVWGGKNPPKFLAHIKDKVTKNIYDAHILEAYTEKEINKLDEFIDHNRDFNFFHAGLQQLCDKYLMQNRITKEIYETPQFAYMLIAMVSYINYDSKSRLDYVKRAYDQHSKFKTNLPTPIMAGARSPIRQFASCCLIDVDDTAASLAASAHAVAIATTKRYGIGLNFGRIRGANTPVRNGEVVHPGAIPFLRSFESTVKAYLQNGIRGGSATVNIPFWHLDFMQLVVLKNNTTPTELGVKGLDYCFQFSKVFYQRIQSANAGNKEIITLFCPHEAKELYEAFGTSAFDALYAKFEKDPNIKYKREVDAEEYLKEFTKQQIETGRIYMMNIDHVNSHGPWLETVRMTNLCVEITQPVTPIQSMIDPDGEIGICVLGATNLLEITSWSDLEKVCDNNVRSLDAFIDYQTYFVPAAEKFTKNRRSLGIGITNLAALLAKNDLKYTDKEAPNFVDEWMERIQYYLLQSSCKLAQEKGPCAYFDRTKYSKGILPIDTYKKNVDNVVTRKLSMDWEKLRQDILKYGLRNSTVSAIMPCESSSVIQCSTNGIEPPRDLVTYKKSKARTSKVLVPHVASWKGKYTLAYDMEDNTGIINIVAALQKYVDMSISANIYYDYNRYPDGKIPHELVNKEMLYAYSMGIKTIYYTNTNDDMVDADTNMNVVEDSCASGACAI